MTEISAVEAARRLGVGLDYVYGLLWTGRLAGRKEQNRWFVSAASVDERFKRRNQGRSAVRTGASPMV